MPIWQRLAAIFQGFGKREPAPARGRISVVIPCHNDGLRLERAVASCLNQAELNQIIVVDDCSTDDTPAVISQLQCRHHLLMMSARTARNGGPAAARNKGAAMATGEFLCFLDSDDEYVPGYFRAALAALDGHPEFSAVRTDMLFVGPDNKPVLNASDPRYLSAISSSPCNLMLRRTSFQRLGGFPESAVFRGPLGGEDVAFSKALEQFCQPMGYIRQSFYRCHDRPGSHLQRFLGSTALTPDGQGFVFKALRPEQGPGGMLEIAINTYLNHIASRLDPDYQPSPQGQGMEPGR
ncbi:MAG: glycosyltransferase family A protein [Anaerolineae bacterium]|jgi:glycosyltransferase involved in cell wall biosynthesis|nr:glycosyltransferase family A protein [Anaerolineae bacterium]